MLMLPRICDYLSHLGLRDFISKDPAHSFALGMDLQHNPGCLGAVHRKESLQNINDELHGGIVVIYEHDLIERRTLELWRRFLGDQTCPFAAAFNVTHEQIVIGCTFELYKRCKQNPRQLANVAKQCHFTLTSKNKCLSGLPGSPMIIAPRRPQKVCGKPARRTSRLNLRATRTLFTCWIRARMNGCPACKATAPNWYRARSPRSLPWNWRALPSRC